jgi:hypothetical protein
MPIARPCLKEKGKEKERGREGRQEGGREGKDRGREGWRKTGKKGGREGGREKGRNEGKKERKKEYTLLHPFPTVRVVLKDQSFLPTQTWLRIPLSTPPQSIHFWYWQPVDSCFWQK